MIGKESSANISIELRDVFYDGKYIQCQNQVTFRQLEFDEKFKTNKFCENGASDFHDVIIICCKSFMTKVRSIFPREIYLFYHYFVMFCSLQGFFGLIPSFFDHPKIGHFMQMYVNLYDFILH